MNPVLLEEMIYLGVLPLLPVVLHSFFSHCLSCRVQSRLSLILLYFLYMAAHVLLHLSALPAPLLMAANVGLILALSLLLYRGGFLWRGYAALFISALIILSDAVIPLSYTENGYRLSLLLSKLLMLLLVLLLRRIVKGNGQGQLTGWLWTIVFLCPLLSIFALHRLSDNPFFQLYPQLFLVVPALLLAINVLIFVLSDRIMTVQTERSQRLLLEQQNSYYVNQYHRNREFQEEAFRFRHDLGNILLGLSATIRSGGESGSEAELEALLGWSSSSVDYCHTGNPVIDSILDYKRQHAAAEGIDFRLSLNLPPRLILNTVVISVILGNALDNALEAVCRMPQEAGLEPAQDRYIAAQMHYLNDSLFIRIQNPYSHTIAEGPRGELLTTKDDKRSHGIGLRNIRQTLESNGGMFDLSYSGKLFQLELVLFHIQREDNAGEQPYAAPK